MSQRDSGYARKERDLYETPEWATEALRAHLPRLPKLIWEPAAGSGKMSNILSTWGCAVVSSDIEPHPRCYTADFLECPVHPGVDAIITNPIWPMIPRALKFVRYQAIEDHLRRGWMAMIPNASHRHLIYGIEMKWICDCPIPGLRTFVHHRVPPPQHHPGAQMSEPQTGHNSNTQLKSIVERIENLDEQIGDLRSDQKEIFQEAKSGGFDVKALRTIIRLRKQSPDDRAAQEAILDTYKQALGMLA